MNVKVTVVTTTERTLLVKLKKLGFHQESDIPHWGEILAHQIHRKVHRLPSVRKHGSAAVRRATGPSNGHGQLRAEPTCAESAWAGSAPGGGANDAFDSATAGQRPSGSCSHCRAHRGTGQRSAQAGTRTYHRHCDRSIRRYPCRGHCRPARLWHERSSPSPVGRQRVL